MLKEKIDSIVNNFIKDLSIRLGERLECVGIIGGYARGQIIESWPDINFFIIFKDRSNADDWLTLGEVVNKIIDKHRKDFRIKVEFRPVRYLYPKGEGETDLFITLSVFDGADKYMKPPFGVSELFLSGVKNSMKVVFGSNILEDLPLEITEKTMETLKIETLLFKIQLVRIPCQYDLEKETSMFMNESMSIGKSLLYNGVEAAMSLEDLKNGKHLSIIESKESIKDFYKNKYDNEIARCAEIIIEARKNLLEWKKDKEKTKLVYKSAMKLVNAVFLKFTSR